MKKVTIIGGGLSGLITSIQLARAQVPVQLFEKKKYPFHRVCGEYISSETIPFLRSLNLFPDEFNPAIINRLQLTSVNGKSAELPLRMGGFGISRYEFDNWLYKKAVQEGVDVQEETEINKITFKDEQFNITSHYGAYLSDVIIGSFGKRSKIDVTMGRSFVKKRSPYIGVKYHILSEHPHDLIALHNFKDGYCGSSKVENNITNLCYLSHRNNLKKTGSIKAMEETILFQNPFLREIFKNSKFLFDQPEVINEISFETKTPVENHVLMCGDAAGMITPLCGNGMAMAIHSSKILSECVFHFCANKITRSEMESTYSKLWTSQFSNRLWVGRQLQRLFGSTLASDFAVGLAQKNKPIANYLVRKSHGRPF